MDNRKHTVIQTLLALKRGTIGGNQAMQSMLSKADPKTIFSALSTSEQKQLEAEAASLANDPEKLQATLAEIGIDAAQQQTLFASTLSAASDSELQALQQTLLNAAPTQAPTQKPHGRGNVPRRVTSLVDAKRYTLKREFARGGMGRILLAIDHSVGREVALKELLAGASGAGAGGQSTPSPELEVAVERFLREARVTGALEHPNIVPVYEVGERDDGSIYYTMKFVRGRTMAQRLREIADKPGMSEHDRLGERLRMLDSFVAVCNALAYAHARGVVHRDLKPLNVMIGEFGETVLIDWGLARVRGQTDEQAEHLKKDLASMTTASSQAPATSPQALRDAGSESHLTLEGSVMGTPAYMPPEQARGEIEAVDEQSDVYSLGAMLYEILAGHAPFVGRSAQAVLAQVLEGPPLPLAQVAPDTPPELVAVVERAMARDKAGRYASARDLAEEVQAFRDGRTLKAYHYSSWQMLRRFVARNRAAVSVAAIGLAALVVVGILSYRGVVSERDRAESEKDRAEQALTQSRASLAESYYRQSREALSQGMNNEAQAFAAQTLALAPEHAGARTGAATTAVLPLRAVLAHDYDVRAVAFSPDGAWLACGGDDRVTIWDAADMRKLSTMEIKPKAEQSTNVASLAFSPDCRWLVVGCDGSRVIQFWDAATGRLDRSYELIDDDFYPMVRSLAFAPDGSMLAVTILGSSLQLLETATGRVIRHLRDEDFEVNDDNEHRAGGPYSAAFSSDASALYVGCESGIVRTLWLPDLLPAEGYMHISFSPIQDMALMTVPPNPYGFVPRPRLAVATGQHFKRKSKAMTEDFVAMLRSQEAVFGLWDLRRWADDGPEREAARIEDFRAPIISASFSSTGDAVACATHDGFFAIYAWNDRRRTQRIAAYDGLPVCVRYSPDGRSLATCTRNVEGRGVVRLWEASAQTTPGNLQGIGDILWSVALSPDGRHGVTVGGHVATGGVVELWDITSGVRRSWQRGAWGIVWEAAFHPSGNSVAVSTSDGTIDLYTMEGDLQRLDALYDFERDEAQERAGQAFVFPITYDDTLLVAGLRNRIQFWQCGKDGQFETHLKSHAIALEQTEEVRSVALCEKAGLIAAGTRSGRILAWRLSDLAQTSTPTPVLSINKGDSGLDWVKTIALSPNGKCLASACSGDISIELWDLGTGTLLRKLSGFQEEIQCLRFSPDGSLLAACGSDASTRIWNCADWSPFVVLRDHKLAASGLCFSRDGAWLATTSNDSSLRVYPIGAHTQEPSAFAQQVELDTGIRVADGKPQVIEDWTQRSSQDARVQARHAARALAVRRHVRSWHDRFEGMRYYEERQADGSLRRVTVPPREMDDQGRLIGEAQGWVDLEAWYARESPEIAALLAKARKGE